MWGYGTWGYGTLRHSWLSSVGILGVASCGVLRRVLIGVFEVEPELGYGCWDVVPCPEVHVWMRQEWLGHLDVALD